MASADVSIVARARAEATSSGAAAWMDSTRASTATAVRCLAVVDASIPSARSRSPNVPSSAEHAARWSATT
jgi:hypothetical protein